MRDRFRAALILCGVILSSSSALGDDAAASELVALRNAYREAVHEARIPVANSYIEALGRLQESLIESGKVQEATLVLEERARLKQKIESGSLFVRAKSEKELLAKKVPQEQSEGDSPIAEGKEYRLEGTKWSWSLPRGVITFEADGKADFHATGKLPFSPVFTWERRTDREFVVTDSTGQGRSFRIRVFPDGRSGTMVGGDSNALGEIELLSPHR